MISWPRGLFLLWLIGTAIWSVGWMIVVRLNCSSLPNGELSCPPELAGWLLRLGHYQAWDKLSLYLVGLSIPVAVFIVGTVVIWLRARTRGR